MKNKNALCISIIIITLVFFTRVSNTHALKRAVFPDNKSLQPIPLPEGGHANISGNANSKVDNAPESNRKSAEEPTPVDNVIDTNNIPDENNSTSYIFWFLTILVVLVTVFVIYYKKRRHP